METSDPCTGRDTIPNIGCDPETIIAMNADIKSLTTLKDTFEPAVVKGVFESVIAILTLVKVIFPVPFSLLHLLIGGTNRTR